MSAPLDASKSKPLEGGPSFPLSHRLLRTAWNIVWFFLASWTPPILHPWRRLLLRLFGARIHNTAGIYGSSRIWYPPNLAMDAHSYLGPKTICYCMAPISFGEYSLASQGAHICAGTHDVDDATFQLKTSPISIGAYAWIAAEAFVGPGVSIGEGAVLGARGVTVKNLEPWTVYAGNPARSLRPRRHPRA